MDKVNKFIVYIFCKIFKIVRCKKFIIIDNQLISFQNKEVQIGIIIKMNEVYYRVSNIIIEIKNDTLTYEYIYVEKI